MDYFGSVPVFRPSLKSSKSHDPIGKMTWSIAIPHFILTPPESTDAGRDHKSFPLKFDSENPPTANSHATPHENKTLWDAYISIYITGDGIGDFWTSSILGTINSHQKNGIGEKSSQLDITSKIRSVLETYKYDKYSARNLVFILHLTEICHIISKRYKSILDALKKTVNNEVANPPLMAIPF
jgi:hypothetical protein